MWTGAGVPAARHIGTSHQLAVPAALRLQLLDAIVEIPDLGFQPLAPLPWRQAALTRAGRAGVQRLRARFVRARVRARRRALGSEPGGSRPAPSGPRPGRRSTRRHGRPPAWPPAGSGPSSPPPRHPPAAGSWHHGGRRARRPRRPAAGWSPRPWAARAPPELQRQAGAAGMVAAGGIDHQHLGGDRQGANGPLEQRPFAEGEQCWPVGPTGGSADAHPGQQLAAVGDRCPGEPRSPAAPAPWTRSKQTKQAPIRNTVAGGGQGSGVSSPRACCSWVSACAVAGQVAIPASVRRSRSLSPIPAGQKTL
jgi:hypothetical protein